MTSHPSEPLSFGEESTAGTSLVSLCKSLGLLQGEGGIPATGGGTPPLPALQCRGSPRQARWHRPLGAPHLSRAKKGKVQDCVVHWKLLGLRVTNSILRNRGIPGAEAGIPTNSCCRLLILIRDYSRLFVIIIICAPKKASGYHFPGSNTQL